MDWYGGWAISEWTGMVGGQLVGGLAWWVCHQWVGWHGGCAISGWASMVGG